MTITANPLIQRLVREGDPHKGCVYHINVNPSDYGTNCRTDEDLMTENARMNETIWLLQTEIRRLSAGQGKPRKNQYSVITSDGARWRAFWWYKKGSDWPGAKNDVLGDQYGSCDPSAPYCFSRLPDQLPEQGTEMLGKDSEENIYRWSFDPSNPTAHAAWLAFHDHKQTAAGSVKQSKIWNPKVVAGNGPKADQDSFMYRMEHGVFSLLLDDDNCDCYSSLSLGHGMCGAAFSTSYGVENSFGVDLLYDLYCQIPASSNGLTLYFKDDDDCAGVDCGPGLECEDGINSYICTN